MNQIQHVGIKLNHNEVRSLQQESPHHSKLIKVMKKSNKTVSADFSLNSQAILSMKTRDHEKEFTAFLVPQTPSEMCIT